MKSAFLKTLYMVSAVLSPRRNIPSFVVVQMALSLIRSRNYVADAAIFSSFSNGVTFTPLFAISRRHIPQPPSYQIATSGALGLAITASDPLSAASSLIPAGYPRGLS